MARYLCLAKQINPPTSHSIFERGEAEQEITADARVFEMAMMLVHEELSMPSRVRRIVPLTSRCMRSRILFGIVTCYLLVTLDVMPYSGPGRKEVSRGFQRRLKLNHFEGFGEVR
mgnify:CR=1 FL=1